MTRIVHAPFPIRRPYTPLFMTLRAQCSALIERMEQISGMPLPPSDRFFVTEELAAYNPGVIIASIDWEGARLVLCWAVDDDNPVRAEGSPEYTLDVSELKQAALATDQPRAYFDSNALHVLYGAHQYLIEFFRDGPTDDIPYYRHLLHARGLDGDEAPVWIANVVLRWDDRH